MSQLPSQALPQPLPLPTNRFKRDFESVLWGSRLMALLAVVSSLLLALGTFCMATRDVVSLLGQIVAYLGFGLDETLRLASREEIVTTIVKAIDTYLIASILLIFGLGFYELFINRIESSHQPDTAPSLLSVRSFEDLKDRMAKLILLVLVTEYFQYALKLKVEGALDLLYLALGILFIGGALYLSSQTKTKEAAIATVASAAAAASTQENAPETVAKPDGAEAVASKIETAARREGANHVLSP